MRIAPVAFASVLGASLGGCAIFADPNAWPQKFDYADSKNIASGPNVRFVNDRLREMPGGPPLPTMCTEPAPDVAVAFGTSLGASANIAGLGTFGPLFKYLPQPIRDHLQDRYWTALTP